MERKQQQTHRHSGSVLALLLVQMAAIIMLYHLQASTQAEARYLPTRSDSTDMEALKDLIRQVMSRSSGEDLVDSRLGYKLSKSDGAGQRNLLHKAYGVERRSYEMPVDSPGDLFRSSGGAD